MNPWTTLKQELDLWSLADRLATLWWRDDDATHASGELDRLLAISERTQVPVALAVIPRDIHVSLNQRVSRCGSAWALQHGWSHANHAPEADRQEEFGPHRPLDVMLAELSEGWRRIAALPRSLPVLVAPWNRMDPGLVGDLPRAGLTAVSTLGPRPAAEPAAGVHQTNVHVDIVDWCGHRGFVGETAAIGQFVAHLRQRREGVVDAAEPTGLMTHHLFHDGGCWWFVEEFLRRSTAHPAVRWLSAQDAFWP
ncbi:MAG TPA: polysaccharide deacetylase family protein [Rhodospirillales bacterium]|nr:polysaccharide deacetylase family protein [Rhodospirillales bacterium]